MTTKVQGRCPMGCGETLFLGVGGYVTCSWHECPRPTAASDVLEEPHGDQHIVTIDDHGFALQHPLRERSDDGLSLVECHAHEWLRGSEVPPVAPGRYVMVEYGPHHWRFRPLP